MVYLAGGFTHALNDVLHDAERERLGVPVFKLAKAHWYPTHRKPPGLPRRRRKLYANAALWMIYCPNAVRFISSFVVRAKARPRAKARSLALTSNKIAHVALDFYNK